MTQGRAAMWGKARNLTAALLALGLAGACGKTDTTLSGETHFVTCETSMDCAGLSKVPTCAGGFCRDEQGNKLPASTTSNVDPGPVACASGCDECAAPGSCSLEAACKEVECDTALVDADACLRPTCENDADCPDEERCLSSWRSRKYDCKQTGASCSCTSGLGLFPVHVCSPTALAGVRGSWQQLVIEEIVIGEPTKHTFLPDGTVTIAKPDGQGGTTTETKQVTTEDQDELERYVNGAELRLELAKAQTCEVTKATDLIVSLELDSTTLEQNVAGCTIGANPNLIFKGLYDIANRY